MTIADMFDIMTSDCQTKQKFDQDIALQKLQQQRGLCLDPGFTDHFIRLVGGGAQVSVMVEIANDTMAAPARSAFVQGHD